MSGVEMALVVLCLQRCAVLSPLLPPQHKVQPRVLRVRQVRRDDLVPRAAEAELHQPHNLGERDTHLLRLELGLGLAL